MVPDAMWKTLLDAYNDADWTQALEASDALLNWMCSGGFPPPTITRALAVDNAGAKAMAIAFCEHVAEQAMEEGSGA